MSRWFLSWVGIATLAALAGTAAADPPAVMPRTYTMTPAHEAPAEKPVPGATSPYIFFNRCVGGCQVTGGTTDDARALESSLPCPAPVCTVGSCSCPGGPSGTWTIEEFKSQYGDLGANGHCYGDSGTTACTQDSQCSGTCGTGSTCVGGTKAGQTCTGDQDCADICDTADYEWGQIMQCLKEIYSPFNVMVSDVPPSGGASYTEDIIAGKPANIGYPGSSVGGIAPGGCDARNNVLSFSFSNINWGSGQSRIWTLCGVAGQETAHAFGLEHEYSFIDAYPANNNSTCMDPMTYRTDCGGEPFFRNAEAMCGEFMERACVCGGAQNSHQKILSVFGPGTTTVAAPTSQVTFPAAGATVNGAFVVAANAGSRRGVTNVELWLNGFKWASVPGAAFGQGGQPDPASYSLTSPAGVPNGVIDIVVKAYDDLGAEGDSQTVTVTKGAPCNDAASCMCLTGQKFENGKCFWDPPSGQLGDACTYPQFCVSGMCSPTTDNQVCTQSCTVGISDSCPMGYDCLMTNGIDGFCYPSSGGGGGGGCCSASGSPRALWLQAGLAVLVLGLVTRRRRRR